MIMLLLVSYSPFIDLCQLLCFWTSYFYRSECLVFRCHSWPSSRLRLWKKVARQSLGNGYRSSRWIVNQHWLVVGPPLWKIWTSIGMMRFPIYGKIKHVPNHQPDNQSQLRFHKVEIEHPLEVSNRYPLWLKDTNDVKRCFLCRVRQTSSCWPVVVTCYLSGTLSWNTFALPVLSISQEVFNTSENTSTLTQQCPLGQIWKPVWISLE